jgi:membrane dipeptidase
VGGDPRLVRIMRVVRTGDRTELLETEVVPQFAGFAASAATLWPVRGMLGLHTLVRTVQGLSGACAMYPKRTVCCCLVVLLVASAASAQQVPPDDPVVKKALAIHERAITLDTHIDILTTYATPALDPGTATTLQCDLPKMKKGGLDGAFLIVFVGQGPLDEAGYRLANDQAMVKFDAIKRLTERMYPDRTELARSPADVERIAQSGKRVIMIGVENGYPMGTDLASLRRFYDLGARYMTLTHRDHNQLADSSSAPAPIHGGLSALGRQVVTEMNRLGMMIDVSHGSARSFWEVMAITKAPVIASHSSCAAFTDSDRNLTDEQLRALARNGGVIQIAPVPNYIRAKDPAARPTLKDFVDHLDHAITVAGIDHVGIGSDFDGGGGVPGFNNVAEAPNVTIELVRRGYSEAQIRKIWGENLLRVWREVEQAAASPGPGLNEGVDSWR